MRGLVRFAGSPDIDHGIQKQLDVKLEPNGSRVTVIHHITNVGKEDTALAPWALTVLAPGGVEIIPLPEKKPHPGAAKNATSPKDFGPNLFLTFWPYFDFKDPRWNFGSKYITLRQDKKGPTKIGVAHQMGWVGYLNNGTLFIKRFSYEEGKPYPDGGVNFVPVADNLTDVSIGSIAFAPSNPQIVYAGAGDGVNRTYFGAGVLKSTDGGQTWTPQLQPLATKPSERSGRSANATCS